MATEVVYNKKDGRVRPCSHLTGQVKVDKGVFFDNFFFVFGYK